MTRKEARAILGNQPKWALRNMALALSFMTYRNTEEDWRRCEALRALGYRQAPKRFVTSEPHTIVEED
jgi:hypothetical protein